MLFEAEIFLRSSNSVQRERGKAILRKVARLADGSVDAQRAKELLAAAEPRVVEPTDPELEQIESVLTSLQGFKDYRLVNSLKRLEDYPGKKKSLQTRLIDLLRSWIRAELPQLDNGADKGQIAKLSHFVAAVRGVAAYEDLSEFVQLREKLFQLNLIETTQRLDQVLEAGKPEEARQFLNELLSQVATAPPSNWLETRSQAELLEQLEKYVDHARVPLNMNSKLQAACVSLSDFVDEFIRAQAAVDILHDETERLPQAVAARVKAIALTREPSFADWQAARDWWTAWGTITRDLPSTKSAALSEVLEQETNKRCQEWYTALDQLLSLNVASEEYQQAAKSLDDEPDTSLKEYRRKLLYLATVRQIEEQIRNEQLAEADQRLLELPANSKDAKRLRTQLKVSQARLSGSMAAAEYLSSQWTNIRIYAENPAQVLLETLRGVWSEDRQEWVTKLTPLLPRAIRVVKDTQTAQELREWRTWLEMEIGLLHECSSAHVKRLADYLRNSEPGELLDQRLDKLLRHWQSNKNTVMLAWAYQAFRPNSAVADKFEGAADELNKESDRVAHDVQFTLSRRGALELFDLTPLLDSLEKEEKRWRSLQDLLTFYFQHSVQQWQPSSTFVQAKTTLNDLRRILTLMDQLKKTDMTGPTWRRDFDEAYSSASRLKNVASRQRLLDDLERLRPLPAELSSI